MALSVRNGTKRDDLHRAFWVMAGIAATAGAIAGWKAVRKASETEVQFEQRTTIHRPRLEVYRAWRRLEDLPRYFPHLASIQEGAGNRSHWVAAGPAGATLEWNAEITEEWEGEQLTWRSLLGSGLQTDGIFRLRDAPDGRGTEVKLCLGYRAVAPAFRPLVRSVTEAEVREGLRRFKRFVETGEIATTRGQSVTLYSTSAAAVSARE